MPRSSCCPHFRHACPHTGTPTRSPSPVRSQHQAHHPLLTFPSKPPRSLHSSSPTVQRPRPCAHHMPRPCFPGAGLLGAVVPLRCWGHRPSSSLRAEGCTSSLPPKSLPMQQPPEAGGGSQGTLGTLLKDPARPPGPAQRCCFKVPDGWRLCGSHRVPLICVLTGCASESSGRSHWVPHSHPDHQNPEIGHSHHPHTRHPALAEPQGPHLQSTRDSVSTPGDTTGGQFSPAMAVFRYSSTATVQGHMWLLSPSPCSLGPRDSSPQGPVPARTWSPPGLDIRHSRLCSSGRPLPGAGPRPVGRPGPAGRPPRWSQAKGARGGGAACRGRSVCGRGTVQREMSSGLHVASWDSGPPLRMAAAGQGLGRQASAAAAEGTWPVGGPACGAPPA